MIAITALGAGGYYLLITKPVQNLIGKRILLGLSQKTGTNITAEYVSFYKFKNLEIRDLYVEDQLGDTLLYSASALVKLDSVNPKTRFLAIKEIEISSPILNISNQIDSAFNFQFLIDSLVNEDKPDSLRWNVSVRDVVVENGLVNIHIGEQKQRVNSLNISLEQDVDVINLNELSFDLSNGLVLEQAKTQILKTEDKIVIPYISAITEYSRIVFQDLEARSTTGSLKGASLDSMLFNFKSSYSTIGGEDISCFLPDSYDMPNDIVIDGSLAGGVKYLLTDEFMVSVSDVVKLSLHGEAFDILNDSLRYLNFNVKDLQVDIEPTVQLLQTLLPGKTIDLSSYYHWDKINYSGTLVNVSQDFQIDGPLVTKYGQLNTNFDIKISNDKEDFDYNGLFSVDRFDLGAAFQRADILGDVTAQFTVKGHSDSLKHFDNYFTGSISDFTALDYNYDRMYFNGRLSRDAFNGILEVYDPNMDLLFDGKIDFSDVNTPVFDFNLKVNQINFAAINMTSAYDSLLLSFDLNSELKGNRIDDLSGYLNIDDISLTTEFGTFQTDSLDLIFKPEETQPSMCIFSEYINASVLGHYNLKEIPGYINLSLRRHMKDLKQIISVPKGEVPNDFKYKVSIGNLESLAEVLNSPLRANGLSTVSGSFNSLIDEYDLTVDIPYLMTKNQLLDSVSLVMSNDNVSQNTSLKVERISFATKRKMDDLQLNTVLSDDTLLLNLSWDNDDVEEYSADFSSQISLATIGNVTQVKASVLPSTFVLSDSTWYLNGHDVILHDKRVIIDSLRFYRGDSYFSLDGVMSDRMSDTLLVDVNEFDLESVARFLNVKKLSFGGLFSGQTEMYSAFNSPVVVTDLGIAGMHLNNSVWGDLSLNTTWDTEKAALALEMSCVNGLQDTSLLIEGDYTPTVDSLDLVAQFHSFDVSCIKPYMENVFENLKLTASGSLDVRGSIKDPELYGGLMTENTGFTIDYISTDFILADTVFFDKNKFVFKKAKVYDQDGNVGYVTGDVEHTRYKDMMVDIVLESDRFLGLNTDMSENEYFYGDSYIGGAITIKSLEEVVVISSRAKVLAGSNITVPLAPVSTANQNDFINYYSPPVVSEDINQVDKIVFLPEVDKVRSLVIDLNFDLTPEANLSLKFGDESGDVIEANGKGNVTIKFQKGQPFQLFGEYNIVEGNYLFSKQPIVNKSFKIDAGSSLRWSGSPGGAIVDIVGTYSTRASLYNLMPDAISESNKNRRVPVDIKLLLTERLNQPNIGFDIELPNTDEETQQSVSNIISSEEEVSRQVLSLLIMNSFYTPDYYNSGTTSTTNNQLSSAAAVTVSEFLSNQLSSWVSQIIDNVDLDFRYMPEQELSNEGLSPEEYEMAISSQFFNDRLTVNGNVGYQNYDENDRPPNLNSNFIGEIDVELKVNEHIDLKAYSHQNDDILYENSNMKQGAGISYSEDFTTLKELFGRYKTRIKRFFNFNKNKEGDLPREEDEEVIEDK